MDTNINKDLDIILQKIAEKIDIPQSKFVEAKDRYDAIGKWLQRMESTISKYNPEIYTQGSFKLGTVTKPVSGDQYDIDLVCQLNLSKKIITQIHLKELVGVEILKYSKANNMNKPPEAGKRCWTLNYADGAQFHMDILPSIPDGQEFELILESKKLRNQWAQHSLAITDNTDANYRIVCDDWPRSNPKGYFEWFKECMRTQYENQRRMLVEAYGLEDVPEYQIKTTLQRAIQILKRHRDMMFVEDLDNKPISIIITTLAAHAYSNENSLLAALQNIVNHMADYIAKRDNIFWIPNPVNPLENFADKWEEKPELQANFMKWLKKVQHDLSLASSQQNMSNICEQFKILFGSIVIDEVMQDIGVTSKGASSTATVLKSAILTFFNVPHRQKPQWPINPKGNVNIRAFASRKGFREMQFTSDSQTLPKHCSLRFEASTDITWPYKIYWQVVNTGNEAKEAKSLRGEFNEGYIEQGKKHKESTLYTGKHWVECFIIKNGECVARSGEFVVDIA